MMAMQGKRGIVGVEGSRGELTRQSAWIENEETRMMQGESDVDELARGSWLVCPRSPEK